MHLVSFLCGAFKKKKPPAEAEVSDAAAAGGDAAEGDATSSTEDPTTKDPSSGDGGDGDGEANPPLKPPPGGGAGHHMRAASCSNHRSGPAAATKLAASVSMKALGNAAAAVGRQASRREHKPKKLKPEESIWKKTIILGEKCRVPDEEDEENILYDEKGKRIPAYHRKSQSGVFSRQTSVNNFNNNNNNTNNNSSEQQEETSTKTAN